jgi:hypothetical protein
MIRFLCCGCSRVLKADPSLAGSTGKCPTCMSRFVIPGEAPAEEYELVEEPPRRKRETTPPVEDDFILSEEDEERPRRPTRRRLKRKKKRPASLGSKAYAMAYIVSAALAFLIALIALQWPNIAALNFVGGLLINLFAQLWFYKVVLDDSPGQLLACLFIPFYALIYFFGHFEDLWRPFLLSVWGMAITISSFFFHFNWQ